jgi:N-acetyl sugar amidotransferase
VTIKSLGVHIFILDYLAINCIFNEFYGDVTLSISKIQPSQICNRCILTSSYPRIHFDNEGVCSICREYDQWSQKREFDLLNNQKLLEKICTEARNKKKDFDALIPLSGGKDSTYVLYVARKKLGLRCLAYTLDTGYLSDHAKKNIENTCKILGVEHLYYRFDPELMNRLFGLFIKKTGWFCSVCMRAIAMTTSLMADLYRVPLIITGTSLSTELPLSREMIQLGTVDHVRNVLKGESIVSESERLLISNSLRRKIGYLLFLLSKKRHLRTYAWFNLSEYVDWNYDIILNTIREELDWTSPSEAEHMDCIIHPLQKYIHDRRFPGSEMERLTLARLIMAGQISREEALRKLEKSSSQCPDSVMNLFLDNIKMSKEEFDKYIDMGPRHLQFNSKPGLISKLRMKVFPQKEAGTY